MGIDQKNQDVNKTINLAGRITSGPILGRCGRRPANKDKSQTLFSISRQNWGTNYSSKLANYFVNTKTWRQQRFQTASLYFLKL
jgi:hypothetical protein